MKHEDVSAERDLLTELAASEDDFDVDLMACGCRVRKVKIAAESVSLSVDDLIRLYNLDESGVVRLIASLIQEGGVSAERVFELAEAAAKSDAPGAAQELRPTGAQPAELNA